MGRHGHDERLHVVRRLISATASSYAIFDRTLDAYYVARSACHPFEITEFFDHHVSVKGAEGLLRRARAFSAHVASYAAAAR
jgi:hypothetical protein